MRVLIVGSGGREHALAWKLAQSPRVERLLCVPGNGGIAEIAECIELDPADDRRLVNLALEKMIDLTVVGPEAPLVAGIANAFHAFRLPVFGPTRDAARLEGSKSFAKSIMQKYGVPTGAAGVFTDFNEALEYLEGMEPPYVVKADGLAAGKGVTVAHDRDTAAAALRVCMQEKRFGEAGSKVIIEEFLAGPEVSVLAFTDGKAVVPMAPAQDYKRAKDGDEGPNTGGMGSYSPVPMVTRELFEEVSMRVLRPTIEGLASDGIEYHGVLYAGLVLTSEGPKVLEFNCRFGDPETQAILPRLKSDLLEVMLATVEGRLQDMELSWTDDCCVTVVLASGGYPEQYETGFAITGLDEAAASEGVAVFHAGTKRAGEDITTAGGRVLNVSALGRDFEEARQRAYSAIGKIEFQGMHYRKDIALGAGAA